MNELIGIGVAIVAAILTFVIIMRRTGGECMP
jgi:hypothetical protein